MNELDVPEPYWTRHKDSGYHREQIKAAPVVGCFYCLEVYPANEIEVWIDRGQTALCARCGIDSVLPGEQDRGFLSEMHKHWFSE